MQCDGRLYLVTRSGPDADTFSVSPIGDKDFEADDLTTLHVIDEAHINDAGTIADLAAYRPEWVGVEHVCGLVTHAKSGTPVG